MIPLHFKAPDEGLNLLCLGAHCDDIEIGCGGTLLRLKQEYKINQVKWIVFASNPVRKVEALASAERFLDGLDKDKVDIQVLDYRDAFLFLSTLEIKERFEAIKADSSPDLIFTHYRDDRHQDHRLISDLTWNTFRNHLILEYEIPKYDGDLGIPNAFCQLDRAFAQEKTAILLECFASQRNKHWFDEETFLSLMRLRGMESANQERFTEAFHVRKWIW